MTKREILVDFDTERDADLLALFDALPEPRQSQVFVLAMRLHMCQEAHAAYTRRAGLACRAWHQGDD